MSVAVHDRSTSPAQDLETAFLCACLALAEARVARTRKDTPGARRLVDERLSGVDAVLDTFLARARAA